MSREPITNSGGASPRPTRADRLRCVAAVSVPVLLVGLVGWWLMRQWRSELPDPVATHFGFDSTADGFTSYGWVSAIPLIIAAVGLVVGTAATAVARDSAVVRTIVGLLTGTTTFTTAITVMSVAAQRGLADAHDARWQWWTMIAAALIAIAVGWSAALIVPSWPSVPVESDTPPSYSDLAPGEQFIWTTTVTSRVQIVLAAVAIAATVVGMVILRSWGFVVVVLVLISLLMLGALRVVINRREVRISAWPGWPRVVIPAESIERADVVEVRAIRDYGGWGYRLGVRGALAGTKGFILRSGSALRIGRVDGRAEVVVIDDPHTAASLINSTVRQHVRGQDC